MQCGLYDFVVRFKRTVMRSFCNENFWYVFPTVLTNGKKKYLLLYLRKKEKKCIYRNVPDFRRVFLVLKYIDINQNTYVQS